MTYSVDGNLPSAFAPAPVLSAEKAFGGTTKVAGNPALAIPVDHPESVWVPTPSAAPEVQPSNTSPPEIRAGMYIASMAGQGPTVWTGIDSDYFEPLPIPTNSIARRVIPHAHRARVGGRTATAAPKVKPIYPVYGGGTTSSGSSC